jgi:glycosyltransferase involved in cell wall biosynthesis
MPGWSSSTPLDRHEGEKVKAALLWWGRFDPDYSRNRILRSLLEKHGIEVEDFRPQSSLLGSLEAAIRRPDPGDALWVPCFRHRDFNSARRYADKRGLKLVFDPLISSWDKVVYERQKYHIDHRKAKALLQWERSLFSSADIVLADTRPHAEFYIDRLGAPASHTHVVPVGAEERYFTRQPPRVPSDSPEVLFFGSFIGLQGPQYIIDAARLVPEVRWTLLGDGPLRNHCETATKGIPNVFFEDWIPYQKLPGRIAQADVLLGIFGDSPKAGRVIPNKVYQALACGRPVVTRQADAYPPELQTTPGSGIVFIPPADPDAIACEVSKLIARPGGLSALSTQAGTTYEHYFSLAQTELGLLKVLSDLNL